jgi:hypothetical protein
MSWAGRVIVLFACATAASCRDVAGTRPSATVELRELERPVMAHGRYDTGEWRIECTIRIEAVVDRNTIQWIDGVLTWSPLGSSAAMDVDPLTAFQVAEFWSGGAVAASVPQESHWIFWNSEPFSLRLGFRYQDVTTARGGSAEYDFDCPARAPLAGKYALKSIDGQPLPAYGSYVDYIYYDTLTFVPAYHYTVSMGYRSGADYDGSVHSLTPYTVRSSDTLDLPLVRAALTAPDQPASLSGDTLVWRLRSQDRVFVWRFVRQ